ncbi:hypothetical protein DFR70_10351 [Nocardia tenerifensis]|uniref:Uncharacterized protein n=1 Tax=Nocardia tenerifensis TaxID=228006 RepID=A0A318K2P5_9NOCA|nr:hypothetical protein [Nocardia tenerifensis]PXX66304.1 hypothetical protein DFR70_10351 [Nocardia tenerifensis]
MSSRATTRPALAGAVRAVAALTVIGSAVAVTALTVRQDDDIAGVVVTQEQPAAAARPATPAEGPGPQGLSAPGGPASVPGSPGLAPGGPVPAADSPTTAHGNPAVPGTSAPAPGGPAPSASVPLNAGGAAPAVAINPSAPNAVAPEGPAPSGTGAPNGTVPLGGGSVPLGGAGNANPFAAAPPAAQPACPLGWPAPKQQGGLASLIGLAPLAGPFSSEAFALGSVYQPILQLAGPILAEVAPVLAQYQPAIDPFITQVQGVEAVVLQAILPYYGPYRDQLIAAEGDLAKTLAPILTRAYNSEIASCFVAWQGQIIDQAKNGRITVASLAHPGTTVELGPES